MGQLCEEVRAVHAGTLHRLCLNEEKGLWVVDVRTPGMMPVGVSLSKIWHCPSIDLFVKREQGRRLHIYELVVDRVGKGKKGTDGVPLVK